MEINVHYVEQSKMKKEPVNLLACGDIHAEKNNPQFRIDDYWGTCQNKLVWIVDKANKCNARILVAGDLFNTSRVTPDVTNVVMAILQEAIHIPYVVAGQHDLRYHTSMEKTPIFTLALAGTVRIIQGVYKNFTGAGFEEYIPTSKNEFLITHTCITEKEPPFFLPDAISAKEFMKKYSMYKYIISGDYHPPHHTNTRLGRHLINVGTMVRNKKDMKDHVPVVWLINPRNNVVGTIEVPHEPFDKVFDVEGIAYQEEHGIQIDTSRLRELMEAGSESVSLDDIVWNLYNTTSEKLSKDLIKEVLAYANKD